MSKLNICVGDCVRLGDINLAKENLVVSTKLQNLLGEEVKVTEVSNNSIYVSDITDPIPIDWVREITWNHWTNTERARAKDIYRAVQHENDKMDALNKKYNRASAYVRMGIFLLLPFILGVLFYNFFIFSNYACALGLVSGLVVAIFPCWIIRDILENECYKECAKIADELLIRYPQFKNITIDELERLEGIDFKIDDKDYNFDYPYWLYELAISISVKADLGIKEY